MKRGTREFDLEKVYDEKISPLMTQIIAICKEHKMPIFATFVYKGDPDGTGDGEEKCCTTSMSFMDERGTQKVFKKLSAAIQPEPVFMAAITLKDLSKQ